TRPRSGGSTARASVQATITGAIVAVSLLAARPAAAGAAFTPWWVVVLVLAIAAATSASLPRPEDLSSDTAPRTGVQDHIVPIIAGGLLLAFLREPSPPHALWLAVQSVGVAMTIAGAGWLLVSRAATVMEQRVFIFATLLLLGGAADYLSLSALLAGLVAGVGW